jgi:transposase
MPKNAIAIESTVDVTAPEVTSVCADMEIEALFKRLTEQENIIGKKSDIIESQKKRIVLLEEYLRLERARRFGPSSEKHSGQAELLFNEAEVEEETAEASAALEELKDLTETASPKKRGRKGLSKSLPRHQVHINLSEEEKAGAVDTFYTVVKEELDITPAKARVIEYLQEKAVFIDTDVDTNTQSSRRLVEAKRPKHPLNKCIASISLLAYIVISKYCDGLSLYGLENIIKRYGGDITRTSMANWMIRLALELQPLVNLAREHQLSYDYLQMDETRVKVLKEVNKTPQSDKWMWVSKGGPPDKPVILFDYDPSRSAEVPARLLEGFDGYLQCDGLASYDKIWHKKGLKQLGCFDHARRKYVEAIKGQPKKKKNGNVSVAEVGLGKINALYRLEREIKDKSPEEKYQLRQKIAVPLLEDLNNWLGQKIETTSKGGLTYKAMFYTLNQWEKLIRYCEDGRLHISNAGAENAIRPFAVGRRRWLFCDTSRGAKGSAIHYSLIETAKANGINPDEYYHYILPRIAEADTVEKWEALLPWNVKDALKKNTPESNMG